MRGTIAAILLGTSWLCSTAASAQQVLAPTAGGFPSEPIVLMVIDEPGSADSVYANQLAEAAQPFSPVPIVVEHREDFSNFGTWEAIRWMIDQGPEGNDGSVAFVYTVPGSVIDLLVIDMEKELGVGLDDLNVVASTEQLPYFIHQRADAPFCHQHASFADGHGGGGGRQLLATGNHVGNDAPIHVSSDPGPASGPGGSECPTRIFRLRAKDADLSWY